MSDLKNKNLVWISVLTLVSIVLGSVVVELNKDSFSIEIPNSNSVFSYKEGISKLKFGRSLGFSDNIRPYYWNGKGYTKMYKARGDKYSDISYSKEQDTLFVKQIILYSKGNLTRFFTITENKLKMSFDWTPKEKTLRVKFNWRYEDMDTLENKIVYVDKNNKYASAKIDLDMKLDWYTDIENIVRAERFKNGVLQITTKVAEGYFFFDPVVTINTSVQNPTNATGINTTNEGNRYWHLDISN